MQFDKKEHQTLTLELIDKAPIQGNTQQVLPILEQLLKFKEAVLSATFSEPTTGEAKPAPKKRTLREVEEPGTKQAPEAIETAQEQTSQAQATATPAIDQTDATGAANTQKRSWTARKPRGAA